MVVSICNSLLLSQSFQNGAKYCKFLQTISRSQQVCIYIQYFLKSTEEN